MTNFDSIRRARLQQSAASVKPIDKFQFVERIQGRTSMRAIPHVRLTLQRSEEGAEFPAPRKRLSFCL